MPLHNNGLHDLRGLTPCTRRCFFQVLVAGALLVQVASLQTPNLGSPQTQRRDNGNGRSPSSLSFGRIPAFVPLVPRQSLSRESKATDARPPRLAPQQHRERGGLHALCMGGLQGAWNRIRLDRNQQPRLSAAYEKVVVESRFSSFPSCSDSRWCWSAVSLMLGCRSWASASRCPWAGVSIPCESS